MKKPILLTLSLLVTIVLQAQNFSQTITKEIITSTTLDQTKTNGYSEISKFYRLEAVEGSSGFMEVKLISSNEEHENFDLKPFTIDRFAPMFKSYFVDLIKKAEGKDFSNITFDESKINTLFTELVLFQRIDNKKPVIATIELKDIICFEIKDYSDLYAAIEKKVKSTKKYQKSEVGEYLNKISDTAVSGNAIFNVERQIKSKSGRKLRKWINQLKEDGLYTKSAYSKAENKKLELTFFDGRI